MMSTHLDQLPVVVDSTKCRNADEVVVQHRDHARSQHPDISELIPAQHSWWTCQHVQPSPLAQPLSPIDGAGFERSVSIDPAARRRRRYHQHPQDTRTTIHESAAP